MKFSGSDFYTYLRPSPCGLRVYLRHAGREESAPGPYEEILRRLGERHEKKYLETLPEFLNIAAYPFHLRSQKTAQAVRDGVPLIYHALLTVQVKINNQECEITGEPDLLHKNRDNYIIRDIKLSRRICEKTHTEIFRQLQLYGWLYEKTFHKLPDKLEVLDGSGVIHEIPYANGRLALELVEELLLLFQAGQETFSPVGWTKCHTCGFHGYCWPRALRKQEVSLLPGIDQSLAGVLHAQGIHSIKQFYKCFDEKQLAALQRPWGKGWKKVGKAAASILRNAQAWVEQREIVLATPTLPDVPNYVMFDLEGLPPQLDELQKIYLWGMQVFGERPRRFRPVLAGLGPIGDREGWHGFLQHARSIFEAYGDIPFVHWHHYEKTNIILYQKRYGDSQAIAERVLRNLLDLLPITRASLALPLPSYSLKVVEKHIGFNRTMDEYGGDWSMAKYIAATEMENEKERAAVIDQIIKYNEEDLQACWAVLNWLKSKTSHILT